MPKTILIADDNQNVRMMLEARLRAEGFDVRCVVDGRQAVTKAQQLRPDLIVLDIMMPHMDGTEASMHLKENLTTKNIPIIYLTALKGKDGQIMDMPNSPNVIFGKPYNPDQLVQKIRELIG